MLITTYRGLSMYKAIIRITLGIFFLSSNVETSLNAQISSNAEDLCFKDNNYFMKPEYIARTVYKPDDHTHGGVDFCQEEVYQAAFNLALECSAKIIGEIGAGSGAKLIRYFNHLETIGFEIEPNFTFLKSTYPNRDWRYGDLSSTKNLPFFDIVICADVIEHFVDPDQLLNWLRHLDFKYLVISTPDKNKLPLYQTPATQSQTGPPINPHHVREWGFEEFEQYISQYFDIKAHYNNEIEWMAQVIIATKKNTK